ncbi:MAG: ScyD/ScyE family protein [Rubrivivax sp.]
MLALGLGLGVPPVLAADYQIATVMTGLVAPRGLGFTPDGALYVTEAGRGGNGPSLISGNGATSYFGYSGGVSRLFGGVQTRVLSGLPSLAALDGTDAAGLQDIVFGSGGQAWGLFGLGSSPARRDSLGAFGASFLGTVSSLSLNGAGTVTSVADISRFEGTNNPDGGTVDSNPYGFARTAGGSFIIADAGGNSFLQATAAGSVSALGVLAAQPNPLPFGPPTVQSVPTSIAIGPDGSYFIGQLTGFPFPAGSASVFRYDPSTATTSVAYGGFTNIIDLEFDSAGNLYVLQLTSNGLASPSGPGSGVLLKIDRLTGVRTTIASDGLQFPGGLAIQNGPGGAVFYVSNHTNVPLGGEVLRISAVPEPGSLVLLFCGSLVVIALAKRNA